MAIIDLKPSKNILTAGPYSWMNFCPEEVMYDNEKDSLIRFRDIFIMPDWTGVEDNEYDYLVDKPQVSLANIAAIYWGEERQSLWWVIAARNDMDLPMVQAYKGRLLKIPSRQWIDDKLLPQASRLVGRVK